MRVYEIVSGVEVRRGQSTRQVFCGLGHADSRDARFLLDELNGKPFSKKWRKLRYYLDKPRLRRPDFFRLPGGWVCNERAMTLAGEAMESAGEYLPVEIEGEAGDHQLYHITNCINVVDGERSGWHCYGPAGEYRELVRPVFKAERFGEESLFKVPEDHGIRSYSLESSGDPDDGGLKAVVEDHGLRGLRLELIGSDDARGVV